MPNESLIIIAHGSRRAQSNEEVKRLAQQVSLQAGDRFSSVGCAFLELASPSIPDAIDAAVAAGAGKLRLLPYFLSAGRHVVEDIPALVEAKQRQYPDILMCLDHHLGETPNMAQLVLSGLD